ncbi:hypothetical protein Ptr902_07575 [Pyrenophora tritici-repentis]|nr:hypothetical protein Ptr902_07575 [Pyrenophora tritici-repentis]
MSGYSLEKGIAQGTSSSSGETPCPPQHPQFLTLTQSKLEKVPEGLKGPCRLRAATSDCLNKDFPDTGSLYFQAMDDAKASMDFVQWRAPGQDGTVPQTEEEHQAVAKLLVNAFKEMSVAKDTEGSAYRKRLSPTHDSYYGDWAIEACAWDIIRMTKAIHTEGFKAAIYDKTVIDSIGQTQQWTFKERIDWICMALKTSKSNAVSLMKNEKIWTIIGSPHKLYNSTIINSVSNKHRGAWVIHGRNADPDHQARPIKRQKTQHNPSGRVDVNMGTEEVEHTKVGGDVGAAESSQSGVTGGAKAVQATDAAKATQPVKTTSTIKPGLRQIKPRKSKYDITPMPASYIARNQDMGLFRHQTPGLPIRNDTSSGLTPALPIQQDFFWRPTHQLRDAQIANDAQIAKLMFGELPKRGDIFWAGLAARSGNVKGFEYSGVVEKTVAGKERGVNNGAAATKERGINNGAATKERGVNNGAAATKGTAATQVYNQPVSETSDVQPQPGMYDADVLEGALLLTLLKDAH